ncbi:MAG TPA: TetR/AcrR family transcriptional regulator, partial [Pyrinomonadaceae bacterium]|nr:TetR/AcrR family transcriptional regulator [Pyrinomonadaceae bacterium]
VGIGKGSVYLHFASKEEIALSHIDRIVERLKEKLRRIAAETDSSPENRVQRMLAARVLHRFDSVQHYTVSISDLLSAIRPRLLERRQRYFAEEARIFAGIIVEGQIAGVFQSGGDALEIAETFMTATNSLLPLSLSTEELGEREEIEEKVARVSELLLNGILKRA